jgi:dihydrofolate reductase
MMVSLDGFVEDANRSLDWVVMDEELHRFVNGQQAEVGAYLHGRGMYELMEAYWPSSGFDPANPEVIIEYARIYRDMPKLVFSNSLERVNPGNQLVQGDAVEAIRELKRQPGKDIGIGGATIAASMLKAGLVDEIEQFVQPVILGGGTPMFPALANPLQLALAGRRDFSSEVAQLRYQVLNEGS